MHHSSTMSNPPFRARHAERSKITPGFTKFMYLGGETQSPLFHAIGNCICAVRTVLYVRFAPHGHVYIDV
ncbi:hypothetical protein PEX1_019130 [Penicillium expansum]|uniref:Uncharacterized protein n=1 Tax=Penicillium expansum TaxID=27334 RepID=A0A0A2K012_PENEN|nr:hypothetical protein PEX2_054070 [Penicillium expansum]KGO48077.1 hypothetical protein PEXP_039410 [Penicillium expansum]KGO59829.1 hypothetical protein PEX2_054070 [Penicillium expansum]KGO61062.1 hypothetical protein PEX1_019130 [Penicillium expansum]